MMGTGVSSAVSIALAGVVPVPRMLADALLISELNPSCQHVFEHNPVAHQTIKGVAECSRAIFLIAKMANPGEAISDHRQRQQPKQIARHSHPCYDRQHQ